MAKLPLALAQDLDTVKPHVADILDAKLGGQEYLGGPSVRGWSKISTYAICRRMYYLESIKKMRPKRQSPALDIGTLFHACMAAHYLTGGQKTYEPLYAVKDEIPEVAQEVARLLSAYFAMYQQEEAQHWDIRAVEREVIGTVTAKLPKKKKEHTAQLSCRFDLVIRKKAAGAPPDPYGPCPAGVYIVDHKCMAKMSYDLTEGYKMDGQFLLMAYLWRQQGLDAVLGKLNGFIINVITKTKQPECRRVDIAISDADVDRFIEQITPSVVEIDLNAKGPLAQDIENWPMNFGVCKSPRGYGLCKYFDFCSSHGAQENLYEISSWKKPPTKQGGTP
jgi:hypothetical protein